MSITLRMKDGDILLDDAGRGEELSGPSKAAQDIAEALLTPLDRARDYGSELANLQVPPVISVFAGRALISKKVDECIQRLRRMQEIDAATDADEQIEKIDRLVVQPLDITDFVFWVNVLLSDNTITEDRVLAVSLRHQESARFTASVEDLVRRGIA